MKLRKFFGRLCAVVCALAFCGMLFFPPSLTDGSTESPFEAGIMLSGTPQSEADPAAQLLGAVVLAFFVAANILLWPQIKPFWVCLSTLVVPSKEEIAQFQSTRNHARDKGRGL
jgi:hypothetical protein